MTGEQLRAARALLKLGTRDLAALAGVDKMAVVRAEAGSKKTYVGTIEKLRHALETAGIIFLDGVTGEYQPTAALRWGIKSVASTVKQTNQGTSEQSGSELSSAAWDDEFEEFALDQPVAPYIIPISDDDRAILRQRFTECPEAWNKLSERAKAVYRRELGLETAPAQINNQTA